MLSVDNCPLFRPQVIPASVARVAGSYALKCKTKHGHLCTISPLRSGRSSESLSEGKTFCMVFYSCKGSNEDKHVTESDVTYGFKEVAQWTSLAIVKLGVPVLPSSSSHPPFPIVFPTLSLIQSTTRWQPFGLSSDSAVGDFRLGKRSAYRPQVQLLLSFWVIDHVLFGVLPVIRTFTGFVSFVCVS